MNEFKTKSNEKYQEIYNDLKFPINQVKDKQELNSLNLVKILSKKKGQNLQQFKETNVIHLRGQYMSVNKVVDLDIHFKLSNDVFQGEATMFGFKWSCAMRIEQDAFGTCFQIEQVNEANQSYNLHGEMKDGVI